MQVSAADRIIIALKECHDHDLMLLTEMNTLIKWVEKADVLMQPKELTPPEYIIAVLTGDIAYDADSQKSQLCIQWISTARMLMTPTNEKPDTDCGVSQPIGTLTPVSDAFCTFCDVPGHLRADCPHLATAPVAAPLLLEPEECKHDGPTKVGRQGERRCVKCNEILPSTKPAAGKFGF